MGVKTIIIIIVVVIEIIYEEFFTLPFDIYSCFQYFSRGFGIFRLIPNRKDFTGSANYQNGPKQDRNSPKNGP